MSLTDRISEIAQGLRLNRYGNESEIREALIVPILMDLGWKVFDPLAVRREYPLQSRRVDHALFTNSSSPSILIEAKAAHVGDGDRQLFEYAFFQGAPFVALVNGREWSFYLPGEQGSLVERRLQKLDLLEREPADAARVLSRYLSFERVKSGSALQDAQADYRNAARERDARNSIPKAWHELLVEPDELLVELIADKVENIIGFRPTDEQVEEFLSGMSQPIPIQPVSDAASPSSERTKRVTSGSRQVLLTMLGKSTQHSDAISALIHVLSVLDEKDGTFLSSFAKAAPGKRRNHIHHDRSKVYPNKPELEVYTTDALGKGWWLGTNIANREKIRLIKIACEVARLKFGKDIKIELPNVSS